MDEGSKLQRLICWLRHLNWWLFLLVPVTTLALINAPYFPSVAPFVEKKPLEFLAIPLAAVLFAVSLVRLAVCRRVFFVLLAWACLGLLFREIHFDYSAEVLIAFAIGIGIVGWRFRASMSAEINDRQLMSWLVLALFYYGFSQFCAKRGFKFLPNERFFHESLEEGTENLAHVVMMVAVCAGQWRRESAQLTAHSAQPGKQ